MKTVFELPGDAPQKYRLKSPWKDQGQTDAIEMVAGTNREIRLDAFEVLVFEATVAD